MRELEGILYIVMINGVIELKLLVDYEIVVVVMASSSLQWHHCCHSALVAIELVYTITTTPPCPFETTTRSKHRDKKGI